MMSSTVLAGWITGGTTRNTTKKQEYQTSGDHRQSRKPPISKEAFDAGKEVVELTKILVRHTVGFGMIEILLEDPKIQDVTINSVM